MVKTNVMRLLDAAGIAYGTGTYEVDENDLSEMCIRDRLIEDFLKGFDTSGINKGIYSLEEHYGFSFGYEAHIQMFFMLSLSIARARKHKFVTMPKALPCKVSGAFSRRIKGRLIEILEQSYQIKLEPCKQEFMEFVIDISDIQYFQDMDQMLEIGRAHV